MKIKKNDIINLTITDISSKGIGVGKYDGMTVFVSACAVGDKIICQIIKLAKNYAIGKLKEITVPSKDRIEPDCKYFLRCGGCSYRHITYESEQNIKHKNICENIKRIAKLDISAEKLIPAKNINEYRNKMQIPVGYNNKNEIIAGFYGNHSHNIIDMNECKLHDYIFSEILKDVKEWMKKYKISAYDEKTNSGNIKHIYLRQAKKTGQIMLCLVSKNRELKALPDLVEIITKEHKQIKTIILNINSKKTNVILGDKNITLYGDGFIIDNLCGLDFKISPLSFFQINHEMTEVLYEIIKSWLAEEIPDTILDLYCGIGTIGLSLSANCKKLIGVEIISDAVKDAKFNAKLNNVTNAEFICADAYNAADKIIKENIKSDVIIVDPPRKGLNEKLIDTIVKINPKKIIYVSCDPATLSRDLAVFDHEGYTVKIIQPVDLFPRTAHVETVALLSKLKGANTIEVEIDLDEMDLTQAESKGTYEQIKQCVLENTGLKVSQLYIAQVKKKYGIIERVNFNVGKGKANVPQVPKEKEKAIEDALRHFKMI